VASALRDPAVIAAIHEALGQLAAESRNGTGLRKLSKRLALAVFGFLPAPSYVSWGTLCRPCLRPLIDVAEAFADGLVGEQELTRAREDALGSPAGEALEHA